MPNDPPTSSASRSSTKEFRSILVRILKLQEGEKKRNPSESCKKWSIRSCRLFRNEADISILREQQV